ncbi:hypothetical protein N7493_001124 [Penicillium malachiteum]|uniref:Uncharacterized protein n=1 Tax=Penicillium malachiteum TaxID=1324776 RepID=A0AAD6HTK5_9EURO|nr:hypothetical protein N7493_001124 [Penicillium malachiteum]
MEAAARAGTQKSKRTSNAYLQKLLDQAKTQQPVAQPKGPAPSNKRSADSAFGPIIEFDRACSSTTSHHEDATPLRDLDGQERSVWANPFTLPSRTVNGLYKGKTGCSWLAPTSMWSLTTRISLMMSENLHLGSPHRVPSSLNEEIYPLSWRPVPIEDPPDISGLPSIGDALYLFDTVKHHLDQHYRFFDEDAFMGHLNDFYNGNSLQKATENRL